ncbi:MAG TPA: hypothetical protein VFZ34_20075, partial [Blastocatellia bacterium]|nr:hypothetical protein [Blastocatellia bacterium]
KLMAAEVSGQGAALEVKSVRALFELPRASLVDVSYTYDVTSDGQRFLVNKAVGREGPTPMTLVQNWTAGLKR